MDSLPQYINALRSGLINKIDIPTMALHHPEVQFIIHNNWMVMPSQIPGWVTLKKVVVYNN